MMRGVFAGVRTAAWLQLLANLTEKAAPLLTPEDADRMERVLDRCEAERQAAHRLEPWAVDRWVEYLEHHNAVLVVGRRDLAVAVSTPKPERVH